MSVDRLIDAIGEKKNPTVLGLDPQPEHIPPEIMKKYIAERGRTLSALCGAYETYITGLIEALSGIVPAVKLQSAFFETLGPEGMGVFQRGIQTARAHNLYVIADAKRGDIGSTSSAYSAAFLGRLELGGTQFPVFDADALTVNPYLGSDNLEPFLTDCERYQKMVFVLCKTSNPSASEVQEQTVGGRPLYHIVAEQVSAAGKRLTGRYGYSSAGIVAGATQPNSIRTLRERHPELFFLVPGYGAQGGTAAGLAAAFDKDGRGAIVNNSRGIGCAWQRSGKRYTDAAREAALTMREDLRKAINP